MQVGSGKMDPTLPAESVGKPGVGTKRKRVGGVEEEVKRLLSAIGGAPKSGLSDALAPAEDLEMADDGGNRRTDVGGGTELNGDRESDGAGMAEEGGVSVPFSADVEKEEGEGKEGEEEEGALSAYASSLEFLEDAFQELALMLRMSRARHTENMKDANADGRSWYDNFRPAKVTALSLSLSRSLSLFSVHEVMQVR